MKTLLSLLLIISITIISWSTYAKNTVIQVNTLYIKSSSNAIALKPYLSNIITDDNNAFKKQKKTSKNNDLFEMTIVFNEKLQQFLASFKGSYDDVKEIANNRMKSTEYDSMNKKTCKENS